MEIKKIKEPDQIDQITQKLFSKLPVKLKEKEGEFPVRVIKYSDSVLEVTHRRASAAGRFLILNHGEYWMLLECEVIGKPSSSNELLKPICLHLKRMVRKEPRLAISTKLKNAPLLLNCVPLKLFPEALAETDKKRDGIIRVYEGELKKIYPMFQIVIRQSMRMDVRMRAMDRSHLSIFAPDRFSSTGWIPGDFIDFSEYEKIKSMQSTPAKFKSEITIPFFYREVFLWGYLNILSEKTLSEADLEKARNLSQDLQNEFEGHKFLPYNQEKCLIIDLSSSGVGFIPPPKANFSWYTSGEDVVFDIDWPGLNCISFYGTIKNLRIIGKKYRVGIEFLNLTSEQSAAVKDYMQRAR